jgi:hypothetical protein
MICRHLTPLLALLVFVPACSPHTKPIERFPGFESAPSDRLATLRESDNVYISSIDGRNAPEPDGGMNYRQFQIPAGVHLIAIYYHSSNMLSHSYNYMARLQPSHAYSLRADVDVPFVSFSNRYKWRAQLIDDATGQPASTQPTNTPASRPSP